MAASHSAHGFWSANALLARTCTLPDRYASADGAPAEPTAGLLQAGVLLNGRYRVARLLGVGSFGRVYLADDLLAPCGPAVAVKELLDTPFQSNEDRAEAVAWFRREASTLLSLRHPAIPALHSFWAARPDAGPVYLAMDYIPGKTLEEVLVDTETQGPAPGCPWRHVVAWGGALCDVLAYLHDQTPPVVFRDLKLANVLLDDRTGSPVLIDFGIAKRLTTSGGTVIGTWGYVPFEQALGQASLRSDIYALGAVLHALLTGRRPDVEFVRLQRSGCGVEATMRALFPPADTLAPGLPPALARVLERATAFDPGERFPDAVAMADALRSVSTPRGEDGSAIPLRGFAERAADARPCLTVCPNGSGRFTSITEAIRGAAPGARIEVRPGLYREALVIDKPLEIIGRGPIDQIVVEAAGNSCLKMHTTHATVRGLTFRGGSRAGTTHRHVVDIPRGRLALEDCRIVSGALSCVAIHGTAAYPVLRRCTIRHGKESGLLLYGAGQCLLEDCEISGNAVGVAIRRYACAAIRRCRIHGSVSHGIHLEDYAEGAVEDCEIMDNGHAGVCIDSGSILALRRCRVNRNARAVAAASTGGGQIQGCDLSDNMLGAWSIMSGAEPWLRRVGNRE